MNRLDGKVALVVDGGSGLGRATARAFAAEGARVMVGHPDSATARATAAALPGAEHVRLDPRDVACCEEAIATTLRAFGRLDVLCNRAPAPPAGRKLLHELSEQEWDDGLGDALDAVALPTRFALRPMLARGEGSIIIVGSSAGLVGVPGLSAYAAATSGLLNFTRNLALEARRAGRRIRANIVCLGDALGPLVPSDATAEPRPDAELAGIVPSFVFLASDESARINGAILAADDGLTAWR